MIHNLYYYRCELDIKATIGGLEAHVHQAYTYCAIGAMSSQTYGNVLWWSP